MDLPAPGGPLINKLWPPAAATSSAKRASVWPRISAISGKVLGRGAGRACGGGNRLATFSHGFIGQANHVKRILPGCQMHLHLDRNGIDALKGNSFNIGDHGFFLFLLA
jgi:hypothetical protein